MRDCNPVAAAKRTARKLRRGLFRAYFRRGFFAAFGLAAFAAGGAVIGVRLGTASPHPAFCAGTGAAALLIALGFGAVYACRLLPDTRRLLVWLDGASHCGGLLAASLETDPGRWAESLRAPELPRVKVSMGRGLFVSFAGLLFLAGTLFFPESAVSGKARRTLDVSAETAALEKKIEVLEEESLMPEKELSGLKGELRELKETNDASDPARVYELLDALSRRVGLAGEEAASRLGNEGETLRMLSTSLDALGTMPPDRLSPEAASQMGELLKKLAADNPELAELLKQSGVDTSDPASMKRLAEAMRDSSGNMERQLARLVKSKLARARGAKPGNRGRRGAGYGVSGDDLAEWLAGHAPGADDLCKALLSCCRGVPGPGNGGVSRGRGDAPLRFNGGTLQAAGREVDLALAGENDPAGSLAVQRFASAPDSGEQERQREKAAVGNLRGGEVRIDRTGNRIYPAHRAAVERYFKTKGERTTP